MTQPTETAGGSKIFIEEDHRPGVLGFSTTMAVLQHEYGHYVHDLYGGPSSSDDTCVYNDDESLPIKETYATMWARSVQSFSLPPTLYTANLGGLDWHVRLDGGLTPDGGRDGGVHRTVYGDRCSGDEHDYGHFFEQAYREMLFNVDCESIVCTDATGFGSSIGWDNQNDAIWSLTSALAYAAESGAIRFQDLAHEMWEYMHVNQGRTGIAANMKSVMLHHGIVTW